MIIHLLVIFLMVAVVAAFLILWYLWARRRVEIAFSREGAHEALFPFRYFSWVMIGLVVATCLAQIHFVRVSSTVHEKLAGMTVFLQEEKANAERISELKTTLDRLSRDIDTKLDRLQASTRALPSVQSGADADSESTSSDRERPSGAPLMSLARADTSRSRPDFSREARASSASRAKPEHKPNKPKRTRPQEANKPEPEVYALALNLTGKVTATALNVRKRPRRDAAVIAKLLSGQEVKVTEKRIINEQMWYRVITSSGKAGWVDFRYLKIDVTSGPST